MKTVNLDKLNHSIRNETSDGSYYELILTRTHGITMLQFNDCDSDCNEDEVWSENVIGIVNILKYIDAKIWYYRTKHYRTDLLWLYESMLEYILHTLFSKGHQLRQGNHLFEMMSNSAHLLRRITMAKDALVTYHGLILTYAEYLTLRESER